jgi:hypothetical protein
VKKYHVRAGIRYVRVIDGEGNEIARYTHRADALWERDVRNGKTRRKNRLASNGSAA